MATFSDVEASIRQQYDEWRRLRGQVGEDAADYESFRRDVMSLGAPDPGDQQLADLPGDDSKAAHLEWYL